MSGIKTQVYGKRFFDLQESESRRSAAAMVPVIVDLLKPNSVLDVGCGVGPWLAEFADTGVSDCFGLDGPWVDPSRFTIGAEHLIQFDFSTAPIPFRPELPQERFDLVTTFEFLEHVRGDLAEALVVFLSSLSDTVVVSAAAPGQGGTDHVNEQWIDYWAGLFAVQDFQPYDAFRPLLWDDDRIAPWYRQNAVVFFKGPPPARVVDVVEKAALKRLHQPGRLVHPGILQNVEARLRKESSISGLPRRLAKRVIGQRLTHAVKRTVPALSSKD